tara:strand:- start:93 stop:590 length:498 start_codon:yes stop_codon:yes gene_type:complete
MATFKHLNGGNVQSKRVIVSNGYTNGTTVTTTIQQPANSQIVGGHYRQLQKATVASGGSVGIDVGIEGSLTSIFSDADNDAIAEGVSGATAIPVGFFLNFATGTGMTASQFSVGDAASPAVSDGFTSVDREVLVTVTCSAHDVTAETGETADYEVQLDFKMLGTE